MRKRLEVGRAPHRRTQPDPAPLPLCLSSGTHLQVSWLDHETLPLDAGDKRQREPQQSRHATHAAPHQHCQPGWHRLNLTRMGNGANCLGINLPWRLEAGQGEQGEHDDQSPGRNPQQSPLAPRLR